MAGLPGLVVCGWPLVYLKLAGRPRALLGAPLFGLMVTKDQGNVRATGPRAAGCGLGRRDGPRIGQSARAPWKTCRWAPMAASGRSPGAPGYTRPRSLVHEEVA